MLRRVLPLLLLAMIGTPDGRAADIGAHPIPPAAIASHVRFLAGASADGAKLTRDWLRFFGNTFGHRSRPTITLQRP